MSRRRFIQSLAGGLVVPWGRWPRLEAMSSSLGPAKATPKLALPDQGGATDLSELVLFGFDDRAFPFQNHVQTHLLPARNGQLVLRHGEDGSYDENLLFYGTVIRIDDIFHMWYNGNYGPLANWIGYERRDCCICYATSSDGTTWEKPNLGLVEFNGSKKNNIVDFDSSLLWSTCAVLYDPEDPDPQRRFKMAYEGGLPKGLGQLCVAFSPDGLRWTQYAKNPVGPMFEMAGITKHRGIYYVNGQDALIRANHPAPARRLVTFASADFEQWSPCGGLGLDRGPQVTGPPTEDDSNQYEEVHLGAALWNRQNVILGIYGQWHGHFSGDRRMVTMDLGLAVSHDTLHFYEPIPGFRIVPAREQTETPYGVPPALMQGQAIENVGERTLHWYSTWRGLDRGGVRMCSWPRDRMGMLKPFRSDDPQTVSCPIQVLEGQAKIYVNASGLGEYSRLRINVLDRGFRPLADFNAAESGVVANDGLRVPVRWSAKDSLAPSNGVVRIQVRFEGIRPEDANLHAVYLGS